VPAARAIELWCVLGAYLRVREVGCCDLALMLLDLRREARLISSISLSASAVSCTVVFSVASLNVTVPDWLYAKLMRVE
jgi:hypothetical protein